MNTTADRAKMEVIFPEKCARCYANPIRMLWQIYVERASSDMDTVEVPICERCYRSLQMQRTLNGVLFLVVLLPGLYLGWQVNHSNGWLLGLAGAIVLALVWAASSHYLNVGNLVFAKATLRDDLSVEFSFGNKEYQREFDRLNVRK